MHHMPTHVYPTKVEEFGAIWL